MHSHQQHYLRIAVVLGILTIGLYLKIDGKTELGDQMISVSQALIDVSTFAALDQNEIGLSSRNKAVYNLLHARWARENRSEYSVLVSPIRIRLS